MKRRGKPLKQFVLQYGRLFFDGDIHFFRTMEEPMIY